jgi:DNA helicase-2/ATP-dependent DNA helicase PcrA
MSRSKHSIKLSHEQKAVVKSQAAQIAIFAGPGTGKTTLLREIIRAVLSQHANGKKVLFLVFSKTAEQEAQRQINELPSSQRQQVEIRTFHSFGFKLIRQFWNAAGFSSVPQYVEDEQIDAALRALYDQCTKGRSRRLDFKLASKAVKQSLRLHSSLEQTIRQIEASSHSKQAQRDVRVLKRHIAILRQIKARFIANRRVQSEVNYDDQLRFSHRLLSDNAKILATVALQYDLLLIDEYQDLNLKQIKIANLLALHIKKTVIVGDASQSIYSFRGVRNNNFRHFIKAFPNCEQFTLTKSYRCSQSIIAVANAVDRNIKNSAKQRLMSDNEGDKVKVVRCGDKNVQDSYLVDALKKLHRKGIAHDKIAVLARHHVSLNGVYRALKTAKIPVSFNAISSVSKLCEVVCSFLALSEGRYNKEQVGVIFSFSKVDNTKDHRMLVKKALNHGRKVTESQSKVLNEILRLVHVIRFSSLEKRVMLISDFCAKHCESKNKSTKHSLLAYLNTLQALARRVKHIDELIASIRVHSVGERGIGLFTIHGAKGMEFDAVFIVDMLDGVLPDIRALVNDDKIDEERRVFFVAITRAKRHLSIIIPSFDESSRFVEEISKVNAVRHLKVEA